jgi:hypothetical protein
MRIQPSPNSYDAIGGQVSSIYLAIFDTKDISREEGPIPKARGRTATRTDGEYRRRCSQSPHLYAEELLLDHLLH